MKGLAIPSVQSVIRTGILIVVLFAVARMLPENVKKYFRV